MDPGMEKIFGNIVKVLENQQELLKKLQDRGDIGDDQQAQNLANQSIHHLSNQITEFCYDPDENIYFETWFARFEDVFKEDAKTLDDNARVRMLLHRLHTANHEKYLSLILPKNPREFSFDDTVKKLKEIFGPQKSLFNMRYECLQQQKKGTEDFVSYAGRINRHCESFNLTDISADQFKCLIFISGLRSPNDADIRTRLLSKIDKENTMTLEKLITECHQLISLKKDTHMIENHNTRQQHPVVNAIGQSTSKSFHNQNFHKPKPKHTHSENHQSAPRRPCWLCGGMHYAKDCPFKDHRCKVCSKVGHKEGYSGCSSSAPQQNQASTSLKYNKKTRSKDCFSISGDLVSKRKYVTVKINGVPVKLQLDTASDITIISRSVWERIGEPTLVPTHQPARSASGQQLKLLAEFECDMSFYESTMSGKCFMSAVSDLNLLGIDWIEKFNLWNVPINAVCNSISSEAHTLQELKKSFPEVFKDELGLCNKTQVTLHLKPGAKPIYRAKRPVAYSALTQIDEELNRLQHLGIITPVDFSDWAAPIVCVKKSNGRVRICADYSTGLNDSLEPHQFPLPLPEDIFAKLANGTVFSQIDLSDAFLQVKVDEQSRKLLTINTHRGLYQFNRLPFGIKAAPGAFQQIMSTMVEGLDGVAAYMDDLIVSGVSPEEHRDRLYKTLQRIRDFGFNLKIEKCNFFMKSIKYLGRIIDKNGTRPDPTKVEAITNMPPPKDFSTLQSYLGAINYYGKFIKNMHQLRRPLDALLKKDAKWDWSSDCQKSFDQFKEILKSDLMLTHYNPDVNIVVAADASQFGIGACIFHRFPDGSVKAISHASRSLTKAEIGYGQIEKEALGLIFAVTKFHRMIYGRKFTLQTDHKPLLAIFGSKKGIPVYTANRLQRWACTMLLYDFDIEYVSTDKFGYADILSRLINSHVKPDEDYVIASIQLEGDLHNSQSDICNHLPITFSMVQKATQQCEVIQQVISYVNSTWPRSANDIDHPNVQSFFKRQQSLSVVNNCLMFGERIVIPQVYQAKVLHQLHKAHQGMERMKSIARSYVYWPGIDDQITELVKQCNQCASVAKSPTKVPLESWSVPEGPWQRIHIDFAGPCNDVYFVVIVDAYSKWPEIFITQTITAVKTIKVLDELFARFGLPKLIVSDNGTQFVSEKFRQMCESNGIEHLRCAPYHPQSNGQAERFVDTLKRALKKIQGGESLEETLQIFLSSYRSTPNPNTPDGRSPADIMFGRKIRTTFDLLMPSSYGANNPSQDQKQKQNDQFNKKHGARARSFIEGDLVFAKVFQNNNFKWYPGKVHSRIGRVMYKVILEDRSRIIRSHTNQLKSRHPQSKHSVQQQLPIQVLLDEFQVQQSPNKSISMDATPSTSSNVTTSNNQPSQQIEYRQSNRARKLPQHLVPYLLY